MSTIPEHLRYTTRHEWVDVVSDTVIRVGITDFAQDSLGDIVYLTLPVLGEQVNAGETCGEVESTKSVSDIYAPLSGVVHEVNDVLDANPELVNTDPYGDGWMVEIEVATDAREAIASAELLDAFAYAQLVDDAG